MMFVIAFITILGILTGVFMLLRGNKIKGIMQIVLAVICPVLAWLLLFIEGNSYFWRNRLAIPCAYSNH